MPKTLLTLEELQKQFRDVITSVYRLPISQEAKEELTKILTSHSNTAFETLKRAYETTK